MEGAESNEDDQNAKIYFEKITSPVEAYLLNLSF